MFSIDNDEDPLDFNPTAKGSQGLKSLFGGDIVSAQSPENDSSLKFSAPKQPRPSSSNGSNQGVWMAIVAQIYSYQNNKYDAKGKLGVAVTKANTVMIYGQQKRVITNCNISDSFILTVVAENFVTFYDAQQQCWGIQFPSDNEIKMFLLQVSLVKFHLHKKLLVQQTNHCTNDVRIGKEDNVTVRYTGWLINGCQLGEQFDAKPQFSVNPTKSSVIEAWKQSLVGCLKNGIYYVLTDSTMAYGAKGVPGKILPHSNLAFEIEVLEVSMHQMTLQSPANNELTDSSVDSYSVKPKRSGSDLSHKNDILSRMAKMGAQPALPTTTPQTPSSPEAESEVRSRNSSIRSTRSRRKGSRPVPPSNDGDAPQIPVKPPSTVVHQHLMNNPHSLVPSGMFHPFHPGSTVNSAFVPAAPVPSPHVISPSELKETLDVSRGLDKTVKELETMVKRMEGKVSALAEQAVIYNTNVATCPAFDTQVIMHNIQRIIVENTNLKTELEGKNQAIEEQSIKISKILNRNQELMNAKNEAVEATQNTFLANSNLNAQQIRGLEEENERLKNELKKLNSDTSDVQFQINAKDKHISSLKNQIETLYSENNKMQASLFEARNELSKLKMTMSSSGSQEELLQFEINRLKDKIQNAFSEKLELTQQLDDQYIKEKEIIAEYDLKLKRAHKQIETLSSNTAIEEIQKKYEDLSTKYNSSQLSFTNQLADLNKLISGHMVEKEALETSRNDLQDQLNVMINIKDGLGEKLNLFKKQEVELKAALEDRGKFLKHKENQILQLKDKLAARESNVETLHTSSSGDDTANISAKVKEILNSFFKTFRGSINVQDEYTGEFILTLTMKTIKAITLSMLAPKSESPASSSESESEDEDEDDDGDEEEDDDDGDDNDNNGDSVKVTDGEPSNSGSPEQFPQEGEEREECSPGTCVSTEFHIRNSSTDFFEENLETVHVEKEVEAGFTSTENQPITEAEEVTPEVEAEVEVPPEVEPGFPPADPPVAPVEFTPANDEDELFDQPPPVSQPQQPSPAPASFEPNVHDSVVNVEDISCLSAEVFGDTPDSVQTSPNPTRRERPPPLFSDSEDDGLDFLT